MKSRTLLVAVVGGLSVASGALAQVKVVDKAPPVINADVRREGADKRRAELTTRELNKLPADFFASLSDWTGGAALDAKSIEGKVVLVVTWSSWLPTSQNVMNRVQALSQKYGKDGLVILAVHDERKWDAATEWAKGKTLTNVMMARDTADGKFRKAILSDGDPDVYIIDRAGNLRFADIESDSVDRALEIVMPETVEAANGRPGEAKAALAKAASDADKTRVAAGALKPGEKIEVTFIPPDGALYEKTLWPKKRKNDQEQMGANDVMGQKLPIVFGTETWLSEKPNMLGKVVVVDFWATWCVPCLKAMPMMENLQKLNRDDVVVLGVTGVNENKIAVQRFMREHKMEYPIVFDNDEKFIKALGVRGIPHVMIISTDGVVRWQGHPEDPDFRHYLDRIVEIDPGIKSRRSAEKAAELRRKAG